VGRERDRSKDAHVAVRKHARGPTPTPPSHANKDTKDEIGQIWTEYWRSLAFHLHE